jgi:hypothetical protein
VVLADDTVALLPDADVAVDAVGFQAAAEAALQARDPALAAGAADAYTGELLPEDVYEPWTEAVRERLRLLHLDVLRLAGRWEALAAADPADEAAHLALAHRLAADGDRRAALRQLERLERGLRRELGVGPSAEVGALRAALLAAEDVPPPTFGPVSDAPAAAMLGREVEVARAGRLLDEIGSGRGRVLLVSGPAGVGRTALLAAVERAAAGRRMRVGAGVAARVEGGWPYAPVLEAVADLCRRHPALLDGLGDTFRDEIDRALSGRAGTWDGQGAHQRLFVATAELLRLAAAGSGAALVIDDADRADDASVRLLHYLARATVTERVLVVIGHRPVSGGTLAEARRTLLSRGAAVTIDLAPLDPAPAEALVRRHAPRAGDDLVQSIVTAAGGLPVTLVDLARAAAADRTGGPSGVLVAWLDQPARSALAAAAVLGSTFDTDELAGVAGLDEGAAFAVIDTAVAAGVVERTGVGFAFRTGSLRDALLGAASAAEQQVAHRRAAEVLARLGRSPARVGHHLVQAGDAAAAVPWVLQAAETEAALGAYRDALALLEPIRPQAAGDDLVRLLALRADLLGASGDIATVAAYRAALDAERDPQARNRLRVRLARAATAVGDLDTAELALAGLVPDGGRSDGQLLLARGHLAFLRADLAGAEAAATEARARVGLGVADAGWELFDLVTLQGLLAHHRGEWFQRLRAELRAGIGRPALAAGIFDSHLCVAEYLLYGPTPYDDVLALAADLRRTAERAGVLRAVAFATVLRGEAALLKGDLELAERELQDAVELHHDLESAAGEAHSLQRLAEVRLVQGDREGATRLLHRALPIARWSAHANHLLQRIYGSLVLAAPDAAAARAVVDRAEATLADQDTCMFCAIMLAVPAARACADVGDLADARRYLQAAEESEARWEGTSWQAALLEARAHLARAEGRPDEAAALLAQAAALFEVSGQPLDAARCRT